MDDSPANRDPQYIADVIDIGSSLLSTTGRRPVRIRIPSFPSFKPLTLDDQFEIEQWVKLFPPYSDFNFVSLWSWNTSGQFEVSWLNDNLVVLFNDYGTGERFLSFIGMNAGTDTAYRLLEHARERGITEELRLLPAETAAAVSTRNGLEMTPAPHHRDYVLSTRDWSTLAGGHFRNKRHAISVFEREFNPECKPIDLGDSSVQQAIVGVFGRWVTEKDRAGLLATDIESTAVRRVFSLHRPGDLLGMGLFVDGEMIGYSINERLSGGYAMGHHTKVVGSYAGGYAMLQRQTCRQLHAEGFSLLNIQQDLGEPGLAMAKRLYRPQGYLFKYQVARKSPVPAASHVSDSLLRDLPLAGAMDGWMNDAHI